ncbi:hypothetical protein [Methylocystis sp. ATCC 49242]|uniref:hypothetical protein n=1 Tax=Methylocystis sp. ATCC 49242 TaxID=622637 RepID=UPI0001F86D42|nr:hypothetical protein [Methylocystis sp. ATCC 49242]
MSAKPKHAAQDNGEPVLVVMGLDDTRKPHASTFDEADAKLAAKAAGLMGMRVVKLDTAELKALAAKLPRGKVFASGRAFVPFVKASLYASIVAAAGLPAKSPKPARMATASPPDGHSGAGGGDQPPDTAEATPAKGWGDIGAGSLVLATTGPNEGWYEAVVIEVHGDLLKLQWWSWPDEPLFARKISQVGLLPRDPA